MSKTPLTYPLNTNEFSRNYITISFPVTNILRILSDKSCHVAILRYSTLNRNRVVFEWRHAIIIVLSYFNPKSHVCDKCTVVTRSLTSKDHLIVNFTNILPSAFYLYPFAEITNVNCKYRKAVELYKKAARKILLKLTRWRHLWTTLKINTWSRRGCPENSPPKDWGWKIFFSFRRELWWWLLGGGRPPSSSKEILK